MGQRFEGRNLQDALENAARELGVEPWRIGYSVVVEKRGFLGGIKRIVIDVEVRDEIEAPLAPAAAVATAPVAPRTEERPRETSERRERSPRGRREGSEREPRARSAVIPRQGPESEEALQVREWCEELFALMDLDLEIRTEESAERIDVRLYGRDARKLTQRGGEALDSLQVIATKALIGRAVSREIEFDAESFKERRSEELADRARALADDVRAEGRERLLPAMSPVERRIVHLALKDDAEVTTESRGEGFYKRVAIVPRSHDAVSSEA